MPARKGQGQWALGYREPLNPNERAKRDSDGLAVRQRIVDIYQHTGFAGIDPGDLRGRFRWFGLYTQRRPGIAGGKTALLEPEELEDEHFMLRIRIDGGALTSVVLTSSCTGSASRTCRRSGSGSRPSVCRPPRPAATHRE
jgi:sulfite reductase (ferredoxin)